MRRFACRSLSGGRVVVARVGHEGAEVLPEKQRKWMKMFVTLHLSVTVSYHACADMLFIFFHRCK